MRDLTLRALRIFEAAAATASFSRAAELLDLSQSAVSQQIRQLEAQLEQRLFDTQARPIQLTDAGRELLTHARAILAQVAIAGDAMRSLDGHQRGLLLLGVVSPAHYFAPLLVTAFRQRFPQARIRLLVDGRDTLLAMLAEHRVDLVIAGYPPAQAEFEVEAFARHPHCLVSGITHNLAGRSELSWHDLRDEPFIFREQGSATRHFLEHLLQTQGLQVNASIELQGNETVKAAVMAGMGISFLSAHVFQTELAVGRIAVLDVAGLPKWLDWCLLHRRDLTLAPLQQAFREFVLGDGAGLVRCALVAAPDQSV
ncbi:MAG: LysR family transcriptional regulator [Burkholderiales bacterium]|nr:LysR family transcriptional regulator [Burkholderiales bacterium]